MPARNALLSVAGKASASGGGAARESKTGRLSLPMSRRSFVCFRIVGAFLVALSSDCSVGRRAPVPAVYRDAPVVLISIDTLRADHLPLYGYHNGSTPTLDGLGRDGIVLDDLYSHCPLTPPSHSSLLTGLLPARHGVRDNIGFRLPPDGETMADRFKAAGYATGAAVSTYVLRRQTGIARGFDFFDDAIEIAGGG